MAKRLIVNADDYGLLPSVSAGIRQAHTHGLVTSTTAMMNMPSAADDLRQAQRECPALGLGVHLLLTAGRPLLPPSAVPSIVALSDGASFPKLGTLLARAGTLNAAEVKAEWRAQIEAFVAVTGQRPTHLDSHHHSSYATPALFTAMLELAREYAAAIRMPVTSAATAQRVLGLDLSVVEGYMALIGPVLATAGDVRKPDHFEARFYGPGATVAGLNLVLAELPDGATEIMCHPGYADPALGEITSYYRERPVEVEALTQPGLRAHLAAEGVTLISFAAL